MHKVYSETQCDLGEGPLWHPLRGQLFWFDILSRKLLTIENGVERFWQFDDHVSAAGWIDYDHLLMASANGIWNFDINSGVRTLIAPLEADDLVTRSNDGRADPWGGFWIGTMGLNAEPNAGAIYRYIGGRVSKIVSDVTISNAICFSHDKNWAFYTDTPTKKIMRFKLDSTGWPVGPADVFIDLSNDSFGPDGAVIDAQGNFWNAQWGASRVACYSPVGDFVDAYTVPTSQASCPAIGGPNLNSLFVTTASVGLDDPMAGKTYCIDTKTKGLPEYQVRL